MKKIHTFYSFLCASSNSIYKVKIELYVNITKTGNIKKKSQRSCDISSFKRPESKLN